MEYWCLMRGEAFSTMFCNMRLKTQVDNSGY